MKAKVFFIFISAICLLTISISCGGGASQTGYISGREDDSSKTSNGGSKTKKRNGSKIEGAAGMKDFESTDGLSDTDESHPAVIKKKRDGKHRGGPVYRLPKKEGVSGLKAGFADDNKQFNYYIDFQNKFGNTAKHIPINVSNRIILKIVDSQQKSIPNALIKIYGRNKLLFSAKSYSDGTCPFFPSEFSSNISKFKAVIRYNQREKTVKFRRNGRREIGIVLNTRRPKFNRVPLDIVFVFDTTGSMGEEIARLKRTIELIYLNLTSLPSRPIVRFGMVLYKDRRDQYITKVIQTTGNLKKFQKALDRLSASGGGDLPEDLQAALKDSMQKINWNRNGIRMNFIITDAPPHLDYGQNYNYKKAVTDARRKGIKIFSIGTGGLDINGEYPLRQIAQYTSGKFIFLTYGEKGESKGGAPGSVSHHTGANYQTGKLETIIMRFARNEIYNLSRSKQRADEEYFTATKINTEKKEETLQKLFAMASNQLADYSSLNIAPGAATSILPINPSGKGLKLNAEYFTEQLIFSMTQSKHFKLVARKDLQGILKEQALTMSGLIDEKNAAKVGKVLGAKMLVTGKLYKKSRNYEIFFKLIRVETAEVLSVTKTKIDTRLGLSK